MRESSESWESLPVKDSDVVLGKYLGALGLVLVLVLFAFLVFFLSRK